MKELVLQMPYNIDDPDFKRVILGKEETDKFLLGRGNLALLVALQEKADYLLIGGGIQMKNHKNKSESFLEWEFLKDNAELMTEFIGYPEDAIVNLLNNRVQLDEDPESCSTESVINWVRDIVLDLLNSNSENVRLDIVSDGANLSRVQEVAREKLSDLFPRLQVVFWMSHIQYAEGANIVIEPPLAIQPEVGPVIKKLIREHKHQADKAKVGYKK